ncbi:MAG: iodotyrosine deiodinase [Planctomycetota bacterium]|jgi:iodotyrosine deiodinase
MTKNSDNVSGASGPYQFIPYSAERHSPGDMLARAEAFRREMAKRRSVREFSAEALPEGVLDECIRAAGLAPSGANRQPWTFVVVTDPTTKSKIREAAEAEERELYERRISDEWRGALEPLGTDANKPFLETVPAIVVLFRQVYGLDEGGNRSTNYYTQESVGIALGFFIAALQHAGLATLTHTPSPMGFLGELLGRPSNEKAYVLLPIGFPATDCCVPDITKKALGEIRVNFKGPAQV